MAGQTAAWSSSGSDPFPSEPGSGAILQEWHEQPDLLALHAAHPERYPALLHTGGQEGWHILFAYPDAIHRFDQHNVLQAASMLPQISMSAGNASGFPFRGGWLVCLGYELCGVLEPRVGLPDEAEDYPLVWLARIPAAILQRGSRTWLMAEMGRRGLIENLASELARPVMGQDTLLPAPLEILEEPEARFLHGVSRIKDYICAGDVFQVNLSRAWQATYDRGVSAAVLFRQLMQRNPAPFSALLDMGEWKIVSSSPERLVRVEAGGRISTRPIAGTHPRSFLPEQDRMLRDALAAHPKERAEHVMLVDLERNDLGRVCQSGTVEVEALMELSSYAHVHHIESTVAGRLSSGMKVWDVIRALFPGGTITGCPKVRTMEIIRELEDQPRRAYTGSLGYINRDGSLDLNILIRTFVLRGNRISFRAGAGIVVDSVPSRELEETRAKAIGLINTLKH
ncbi:MAG TPA: aminodeoxychorismate synthase component I [Thiobacillaceae bacterium]|nr:aminodeoxychorismate synthase component I [Thiobacillaceae bacterium]